MSTQRQLRNKEKAMEVLIEGYKEILELETLVQRGRWSDESHKSLATGMCKELEQICKDGVACIDDIISEARPESSVITEEGTPAGAGAAVLAVPVGSRGKHGRKKVG